MQKTLFIVAVLFLISCKKDTNSLLAPGLYTESSPYAGRSHLNFIKGNIVVKSETGSSYQDSFTYSISTGKILLTPTWTNQYPGQQFDFERIDDNTIKIQNLYPGIPEAPKSYMIFKK